MDYWTNSAGALLHGISIGAIFADCFIHSQQVFNRHLGLDIMDRVENKPTSFAKNLKTLTYLGAHLIRRSKRQNSLCIDPPPQKVT